MNYQNVEEIKRDGFEGFQSIQSLMSYACSNVPRLKGIYLVVHPDGQEPEFRDQSVGGHFKRKNPIVTLSGLQKRWVPNACIIYIGQAGGDNSKSTLQKRLRQYMKFGQGYPVGHWGGRLIWQLNNNRDLIICWKTLPNGNPCEIEKALIQRFLLTNGKMPFANLKR